MPRLSDSMEQGLILSWLRSEGDRIEIGDDLVEIETDKATMTYQAEAAGHLSIVVAEGEQVEIGVAIARLSPEPIDAGGESVVPEAEEPTVEGPSQVREEEPIPAGPNGTEPSMTARSPRVSPLARRMAERHGISLGSLAGSGPGGRIVTADVRAAAGIPPGPPDRTDRAPVAAPAPAVPSAPGPDQARGAVDRVEPTRVQQVVARRMAEAKATVPEFSMRIDVDANRLLALRAEIKAGSADETAPSINDFVVKAVALALRSHPKVNGAYRDGRFELYERINVGVAVAAPDALFVPTVFDADRKSLGEIARTTRTLAERGRAGELTPPELAGGTFTISNLGMYGISDFVPIINPPQAAILAVGAVEETLGRVDGEIVDRRRLPVTLVGDHRILNGAEAAEFLGSLRGLLEQPLLAATA